MTRILVIWLLLCSSSAAEERQERPRLVPLPQQIPSPESNPTTDAKIELGKKLFFDPRLSGDNKMSCATCHMPDKFFGDAAAVSLGADGRRLKRNTQTCLNVGFFDKLFWDGRADSLEDQALAPIESPQEMNQDLDELERELSSIPGYVVAFNTVFGTTPNRSGIAKALAAFQRTLVCEPSPFDKFLEGDKKALSAEARLGLELFRGEAGCIECHHGPLLSDGEFYRLGVSGTDLGRANVTDKNDDRYRFRTPSLRNVADTGPYMHDGSMKTLDDVVMFYYRGIPDEVAGRLPTDTSALVGQSVTEIGPLVAFLKSLSGKPPKISAPELP